MSCLIEEVPIPNEAFRIACKTNAIVVESVVGLVLTAYLDLHRAFLQRMFRMQNHHACNGVAAIHQGGWTFQNLDGMDAFFIDFKSVLIAPLLPFLTNSLVNYNNAIVTKTTNDWLRNACTCTYLGKSWQMSYCINKIRAYGIMQLFGRDDHEGRCCILESLNTSNALHGHFAQDGFFHRTYAVVQAIAMFVDILCRNVWRDCP